MTFDGHQTWVFIHDGLQRAEDWLEIMMEKDLQHPTVQSRAERLLYEIRRCKAVARNFGETDREHYDWLGRGVSDGA